MDFLYISWSGEFSGIDLGFFKIRFYSLMFVAAFSLGWVLMNKMYEKDGAEKEQLDPLFMYTFIGTILGARLGHVIFYQPELFSEDFLSVFLPISTKGGFHFTGFQGLASHGAAIAIPIMIYLYSRLSYKVPFLWVCDRVAIAVALAGFFIRIGNFFNSEIVGKPTDLPWAVKFLNQSSSYGDVVPRHPTQIYEALSYLVLFFILWIIYNKTNKKLFLGYILGLFTAVLWAIRFVLEYFKEPQGYEALAESLKLGLNNGQILSIPFIIIGLLLMLTSKNRKYELK